MAFPPIMSMFNRGASQQPGSAAPQVTPPPGPPAAQTTTVATPEVAAAQATSAAANPTVPSSATPQSTGSLSAIPPAATGEQSPLAQFSELWKTAPGSTNQPPQLAPTITLDPVKLQEAASRLNFTQHLDPALLTRATSGDIPALLEVINKAGQLGFVQATAASGELINSSFSRAQGTLQSTILPSAIRQANLTDAVQAVNPAFTNPAAQPMLAMLTNQLAVQYPTSAPQEIARMAQEYLTGFATLVVNGSGGQIVQQGQQGQQGQQVRSQETDWAKFFSA